MAPAALLFGSAATTGGAAATAGLFGTAGQFALANTLLTVGVGFGVAGTIQQGRIAKAQGSFQEKMALRNQQALERQGRAEQAAAQLEERRVARREKIVKAAQRATVGKSGIGLAGATLSVLADTAFQFSLERNLVLRRGLLAKQGLFKRGAITAAGGRFAKTTGLAESRASFVKAGASILGTAGAAGLLSRPATTPGLSKAGAQSIFGTLLR